MFVFIDSIPCLSLLIASPLDRWIDFALKKFCCSTVYCLQICGTVWKFLSKLLTMDIKLTSIRLTLLFVLKHNFQTIINTKSIIKAHNTPRSYWTCHTSHDCGKKYGISCFGIIVAFYFLGRTFQPRNFQPHDLTP